MSRFADVLGFEVLRSELQTVADETAIRMMRSSFSPIIRDFLDFSTAICDDRGRMIAQGFSLPLHLGAIPSAVEATLATFDEFEPGDLVLLNDPYAGGMHLPDLFLIAPAHYRGRLVGFAVAVAHHADIGGRVPGGSAADSREVFEEGLRLPPVKLREGGRIVHALEAVIRANVRLPDTLLRDLEAQTASCETGAAALAELVARYGREDFERRCHQLRAYSRSRLAAVLGRWPRGRYMFEDFEDHDGIEPRRIPIRVAVEVGDGRICFDFEGTSSQVPGSINCTLSFTQSACYAAVRALCLEEIPVNDGFFECVDVRAPAASVVNAAFPAGVAARGVIGYRIIETIFGALADALPDRVPAAGDGGTSGIRLGGMRDDGHRFQFNDIVCGAWGARPGLDGLDGAAGMAANLANRSIETAEREDPVRVHAYELVADSPGAGRFRGGMAVRRVVELLAEEATLQLRTHRNETPPYGLHGGCPGRTSETYLVRDGARVPLPAKTTMTIRRGDLVEHLTASGGGLGQPEERASAAIEADSKDCRVSADYVARFHLQCGEIST